MRRPGRRDRLVERGSALMAVRAVESADVALALMDAEEGFADQDLRVISLVRERGRPLLLLANKWDKLATPEQAKRRREEIARRLRPVPDIPVLEISAKTGKGLHRLLDRAGRVAASAAQEIPPPC